MSDLFLITDEKALFFNGSEVRKIEVHLQIKREIEGIELDDVNSLDEVLDKGKKDRRKKGE